MLISIRGLIVQLSLCVGGTQYPFHTCPQGQLSYSQLCWYLTFSEGGWRQHPTTPPKGNYIIPTEEEISREPRGFAIDPLGGAADKGRSALPGPVCKAGAFHWPQRRRRSTSRGRSTPRTQSGGRAGIPARAQLGLDYIWREGACGPP